MGAFKKSVTSNIAVIVITLAIIIHVAYSKVDSECDLYLAPSSIPNAGVGVFAGRDYKFGDRIGEPSQGIQVTDPNRIFGNEITLTEYGWNSNAVGGDSEAQTVFTVLPGISMLVNFHQSLSNIIPGSLTEGSTLRRDKHPGAGASTSYNNFSFISNQDISAGQELYASIGESWFNYQEQEDSSIMFPSANDFEFVDQLLSELNQLRSNNDLTDAQFLDILYRTKNEIIITNPRIQGIIPQSLKAFQTAINNGIARSLLNEHSLEWLKEHGTCIDNIQIKQSTIDEAGKGAFAKRFISEGSLVSPAPLVQIMNKENLIIDGTEGIINDRQLLMNYCFGHKQSDLLLCPTTSVTAINHSKEKANVMFTWSESCGDALVNPLGWLGNEEKLLSGYNTRLSLDFIALRDIEPGEELFMDYGDEWESAWNDHVKNWKYIEDTMAYVPSSEMNEKNFPIPSDYSEMHHHSYLCRLEPFAIEHTLVDTPIEDFRANPLILPEGWDYQTKMTYGDNNYIWWWPCDVQAMDETEMAYEALVYKKQSEGEQKEVFRHFINMPRKAIKFVEKSYHSDQHLINSFRHHIQIPDDIFPLQWRNGYQTAESLNLGTKNVGVKDIGEDEVKLYEKKLEEAKCGVYVAPSNIRGAGLGTYVGVSMPGQFPLGAKVPILPVVDKYTVKRWDADDYTWNAEGYDAEYETNSRGASSVLVVNEGCMANFHPGLVNFHTGNVVYDPVLDRRYDPGAGAFSDYVDFSFRSMHEVKAGEEAFISYGESWFDQRDHLGVIPLSADYAEANYIVSSLASLQNEDSGVNDKVVSNLLTILKKGAIQNEKTRKVFSSIQNVDDVRHVISNNGTAETTVTVKSQEWLEENGYCIDHIYAKESTIPQAGKGAFARRLIPKGRVIIPAPLLNTWGREEFEVVGDHLPEDINRKQLIYNYHFAHPESSILFFPTNSAILINHNSERMPNGMAPNAELRWSTSSKKSAYFLQRHLADLKEEHYATMVLDIVATRDINPGEEIFIDYGKEWEEAWNEHVQQFVSPCEDEENCFKSSKAVADMNSDKFNPIYHEWSEDHFTICYQSHMPTDDDSLIFLMPETRDPESYAEFPNTGTHYRNIGFNDEGFDLAFVPSKWYPCKILRGEKFDGTFDVVYFTIETASDETRKGSNVLRRMKTLPQEFIWFRNKPFKSDMHWKRAFRHEIKIPDSIFPSHWKDLAKQP